MSASHSMVLWSLARGAGLVSLVLLTISVLGGILTWSRWYRPGWPRFLTATYHRNVSLLAVALVVVHLAALLLDHWSHVGGRTVLVPFSGTYRTVWTGLGSVAFWLIVLLVATSLATRRIGWRTWRRIHWIAYACWPVAVLHGLGTGTDARARWYTAAAVALAAAVLVAAVVRVALARTGSRPRRGVLGIATAASVAALGGVAVVGDLGGPPAASASGRAATRTAAARRPAPAQPVVARPRPFTSDFQGTAHAVRRGRGAQLGIRAPIGSSGRIDIVVLGALSEQGLVPQSIRLGYVSEATAAQLVGDGQMSGSDEIVGTVGTGAKAMRLRIRLSIDPESGAVSGTVTGDPATTA